MTNIWNIYVKEEQLKKEKEERLQELKAKELAEKTSCDNCGKKPAYPVEARTYCYNLKFEYRNFRANLCEKCKEKFVKDTYYDW